MDPSASSVRRTLFYIPIIHTAADMGVLGASLERIKAIRLGRRSLRHSAALIDRMWQEIEQTVERIPVAADRTRVYQDGLPVCGKELEIVSELAQAGSRNHKLLLGLQKQGAVIMGTESPELLVEEYQLATAALGSAAASPASGRQQLSAALLDKRDRYIGERINSTLRGGKRESCLWVCCTRWLATWSGISRSFTRLGCLETKMEPSWIGAKVLIAEDEDEMIRHLVELLRQQGLTPLVAQDGERTLDCVRREHPDLVLLDLQMPGENGLQLLQETKVLDRDLPVILITALAQVRGAVDAMRAGACDYFAKPFEPQEMIRAVERGLRERDRRAPGRLTPPASERCPLRETLGPSEAVSQLIQDVERVARSNFSVVILGETGSGKEVIAQAVHQASPRARDPFVPVDCGAIPETLLESELFGHERGAFTGASQQKVGRFESARGGTLFLDEISNLPLPSQAKLLRVLQDKVLYHVGGTKPVRVDARLLAASNHDLQRLVDKGCFRRDLYFRLNEFVIRVPPLRERRADIPYLAQRFLDTTNAELRKQVRGFSEGALEAMLAYDWPGNVRQLRSVIRRAVLMSEDQVTVRHLALPELPLGQGPVEETERNSLPLREIVRRHRMRIERAVIAETLRMAGGNKAEAARRLCVDYKTIHSKVKEYKIESKGEASYDQEG